MEPILSRKETPLLHLKKSHPSMGDTGRHNSFFLQDQRQPSQETVASPPGCSHLEASFRLPLCRWHLCLLSQSGPCPQTPDSSLTTPLTTLLACPAGSQTPHVQAELLMPPTSVPAVLPLKQW